MVNSKIIKKKSFLYFLGYKMERFARNNADHIIVISKSFENYLLGQNLTKDKISVVENWVAENIIFPIDKNLNPLLTKFGLKQNDFIIYYSGNIGYTQNIDIIIDIAEELDYISDLIFVIVGEGVFKRHLIHEINVRKIKNVLLFPFQDYSLISNVFSIGDVGLILSKKGIGSNSIPSKTWSIMAAQRCVLASFDINSPLGDVILQANCGFIIEPENKPKLLEAILQLYLNRNSLEEFGINGRKYILENMNPERSVERYIEAFEHIYTKAHTHT